MDRAGSGNILEVARLCFSGKYRKDEMLNRINGGGGIVAYMNTRDFMDVERLYEKGDSLAIEVFNALVYQIAKEIGATAAVLRGNVDAIVFTGGMAHWKFFINEIKGYVEHFAKILVYPGEFEMEALASYAAGVQSGEIKSQNYSGSKS